MFYSFNKLFKIIQTIKMSRITNLDNRHRDKEKETSINNYV